MAGIGLVLNVIKNRSVTMMPGIAPQTMSARQVDEVTSIQRYQEVLS